MDKEFLKSGTSFLYVMPAMRIFFLINFFLIISFNINDEINLSIKLLVYLPDKVTLVF